MGYGRIVLLAIPSALIGSLVGALVWALLNMVVMFAFMAFALGSAIAIPGCLLFGAPIIYALQEPLARRPWLFGAVVVLLGIAVSAIFIAPVLGGFVWGAVPLFAGSCGAVFVCLYLREANLASEE